MRESVGGGFHFKEAVERKELEHGKFYFSSLVQLPGCHAMLPARTVSYLR